MYGYTSILNHEGIAAIKKIYGKYTNKTIPPKKITFLALILTFSNFIFNSKFYLQIKGSAMKTRCATTYANIFMAEFEEKYIYWQMLYLRFMDDIFMIWTNLENELKNFMKDLDKKILQ